MTISFERPLNPDDFELTPAPDAQQKADDLTPEELKLLRKDFKGIRLVLERDYGMKPYHAGSLVPAIEYISEVANIARSSHKDALEQLAARDEIIIALRRKIFSLENQLKGAADTLLKAVEELKP